MISLLKKIGFSHYSHYGDISENVTEMILPVKAEYDILTANSSKISVSSKNSLKNKLFNNIVNQGVYIKFTHNGITLYKRLLYLNERDGSFESTLIGNIIDFNKRHKIIDSQVLYNYFKDLKIVCMIPVGELFVHNIDELIKYANVKFDIMVNKPPMAFDIIIINKNKEHIVIDSSKLINESVMSNVDDKSIVSIIDNDLFSPNTSNFINLYTNITNAVQSNNTSMLNKFYTRLNTWFPESHAVHKYVVLSKYSSPLITGLVLMCKPNIIYMTPGDMHTFEEKSSLREDVDNTIEEYCENDYETTSVKLSNKPVVAFTESIYKKNIALISSIISKYVDKWSEGNNDLEYYYELSHLMLRFFIIKQFGAKDIGFTVRTLSNSNQTTHLDAVSDLVHSFILYEANILCNEIDKQDIEQSPFVKNYLMLLATIISLTG